MRFTLKPNETLGDLNQELNMGTLFRPLTGEMIALIVILSVFAIVGSVGNGLVIFVFQKVRDKTTAHIFIITLAVIDFLTCMVIIPFTIVVEYLRYDIRYDFLCKLYQFLITSKIPLSAFIMVAIAFDRYFCICHPLKTIMTPRRTKIVIGCLAIFACSLGVITALAFSVYQPIPLPDYSAHQFDENVTIPSLDEPRIFSMRPLTDESPKENDINKLLVSRYIQYLLLHNISEQAVTRDSYTGPYKKVNVYIGVCQPAEEILSFGFVNIYQKVYSSLYLVCLVIVGVLYGMIYKFITSRRSRKLKQKLTMCTYIQNENGYEGTRLTLINGNEDEKELDSSSHQTSTDRNRNTSSKRGSGRHMEADKLREETRAANIRTALMLFTVTVVFIVAFLPAWMMTYRIVPTVIVVFYSYFVYNVANPFIYAYMNHIFKDNIQKIFSC